MPLVAPPEPAKSKYVGGEWPLQGESDSARFQPGAQARASIPDCTSRYSHSCCPSHVENFSAFTSVYNDSSLFGIRASSEHKFVDELVDIIGDELLAEPGEGTQLGHSLLSLLYDVFPLSLTRLNHTKIATISLVLMNLESLVVMNDRQVFTMVAGSLQKNLSMQFMSTLDDLCKVVWVTGRNLWMALLVLRWMQQRNFNLRKKDLEAKISDPSYKNSSLKPEAWARQNYIRVFPKPDRQDQGLEGTNTRLKALNSTLILQAREKCVRLVGEADVEIPLAADGKTNWNAFFNILGVMALLNDAGLTVGLEYARSIPRRLHASVHQVVESEVFVDTMPELTLNEFRTKMENILVFICLAVQASLQAAFEADAPTE
ncbi:hypothetical protein SELMODRAFT_409010 [Selaginella moellendorffii]|uniref:Uncharacterized protein n=1 Tax=Selaginella moellendorffii TaxID=88036 RepID=D8R957_SELML|nr:hypothetical protein SELMODRAFT_409010 [Selaginella moellendorffii]